MIAVHPPVFPFINLKRIVTTHHEGHEEHERNEDRVSYPLLRQRRYVPKPRVAVARRLPWDHCANDIEPQRGSVLSVDLTFTSTRTTEAKRRWPTESAATTHPGCLATAMIALCMEPRHSCRAANVWRKHRRFVPHFRFPLAARQECRDSLRL